MSFKSKNLQYERSEPAFLRRIRGEIVGSEDDQTNSVPLPKRPRRLELGDDDGPTYVLEDSGDTVTKEVFEKMIAKNKEDEDRLVVADTEKQQDNGAQNEKNNNINRHKQQVAQIGALSKKRKVAKIVAEGPDSDEGAEGAFSSKVSSTRKVQKPKKKTKQVKLTFDDDKEEGG